MEFSEEWKSFFPIGASTVSPLLQSHSHHSLPLGPLLLNPNPNSLTLLFSSSSLFPSLQPLHLLPSHFLHSSSLIPSTTSSVSSLFSPHPQNDNVSHFLRNRFHLLPYPHLPNVVVFFPTGPNDDKLGFFMLYVKDSSLHTHLDVNDDAFRVSTSSVHRIVSISVNPVADASPVIGYLLASTLYFVHWFVVKHNSILEKSSVFHLGAKVFKTCAIVHACWSPHILEESLVLLESGELFLFDMESSQGGSFKGTRLRVNWDDLENKVWLSCEFSWHPRVLIVAQFDVVFLVDLRSKECNVSCLVKIEILRMNAPVLIK